MILLLYYCPPRMIPSSCSYVLCTSCSSLSALLLYLSHLFDFHPLPFLLVVSTGGSRGWQNPALRTRLRWLVRRAGAQVKMIHMGAPGANLQQKV